MDPKIEQSAAEIRRFVYENGRVEGDDLDALEAEVAFEANERGLVNAAEIARAARGL